MTTDDSHTFDWAPRQSKAFGTIHVPTIPIQLRSILGEWKTFYPLVDSGAFVSVFNEDDCKVLGYDIKSGIQIDIAGVFGESRIAYLHEIELKIDNDIIKSKIAFTEGKPHQQLLGRINFFENFEVCFSGKSLKTNILRE